MIHRLVESQPPGFLLSLGGFGLTVLWVIQIVVVKKKLSLTFLRIHAFKNRHPGAKKNL